MVVQPSQMDWKVKQTSTGEAEQVEKKSISGAFMNKILTYRLTNLQTITANPALQIFYILSITISKVVTELQYQK